MALIVRDKQAGWQWQSDSFKAMNTQVKTWLYSRVSNNEVLTGVQHLFFSWRSLYWQPRPQAVCMIRRFSIVWKLLATIAVLNR